MIERRFLPEFDGGDTLRLAVLTLLAMPSGWTRTKSTSSSTEDRYRLEASYWVAPLPRDGLLTLVCAWPEIGLPEVLTDLVLPDLAVRAAGTRPCGTSQGPLRGVTCASTGPEARVASAVDVAAGALVGSGVPANPPTGERVAGKQGCTAAQA